MTSIVLYLPLSRDLNPITKVSRIDFQKDFAITVRNQDTFSRNCLI